MESNTSIQDVSEGKMTRTIEHQTAKIPSVGYLGLAIGSMVLSAATGIVFKKAAWANFIGLWAPSFMLLGLYNKVVKVEAELQRHSMH